MGGVQCGGELPVWDLSVFQCILCAPMCAVYRARGDNRRVRENRTSSREVPAAAAEDKGWDTAVAQARVLNLRADGTEIQELEEGWTDPVRTNSTSLFGGAVDNQEERI